MTTRGRYFEYYAVGTRMRHARGTTVGEVENQLVTKDKVRFRAAVFHGDTPTAYSEALAVRDGDRPEAGIIRFKHWGTKQDGTIVFEGEREVLLKRRSHWAARGEGGDAA